MVVNNIAGVALTTSSIFLLVVAVTLNSPHLFYMSTALIVTIAAARMQAFLAVRRLSISRIVPPQVQVGQWAQVDFAVATDRSSRRPLISIWDQLPLRLANETLTPSTPVAPAIGQTVYSTYRFQPKKRGRFRWSKVSVVGTDALGLISAVREYSAGPAEMLVLPAPIPVQFDVSSAAGWGTSETEHGLSRGTGIEPRGIREYVQGDSMRYIHWRSTARTGRLTVKEFETGSNAAVAFIVQNSRGSDIGMGARTTLELICGHLAYICGRILRQGIRVQFPLQEEGVGSVLPIEREQEVLRILADLTGDSVRSLASDVDDSKQRLMPGSTVYIALSVADQNLPAAIQSLRRGGHAVVCMAYDARVFDPKFKSLSATDPAYIDELRGAGAMVRTMPLDGLGK